MNSSKLLGFALVLAVVGCSSPVMQVPPTSAASQIPALKQTSTQPSIQTSTQTSTQAEPSPTSTFAATATQAFTPTATPTPEPTAPPTPVSLNIDTAPTFQVIRESYYDGGEGKRFAVAVSPLTHQVAFAGCENGKYTFCTVSVFRLIDTDTGQVIRDLESLSPVIEVLKFSPDGKVLAAAGCHITLAIYGESDTLCDKPRAWLVDVATGKMLYEMKGYSSNVTSMIFSLDGTKLFTSVIFSRNIEKGDYSIHIYDVATGKGIYTIAPYIQTWLNLSFTLDLSPDGRYLITDAADLGNYYSSFVQWWDIQDPAHPRPVGKADYAIPHSVSSDSSRLIVQNPQDKTFYLYNLDTGSLIRPIPIKNLYNLQGFSFGNDGNTFLLDYGTELDITRVDTGEIIKHLKPDYDLLSPDYLFSPDRRLMLTTGYKFNGGEEISKTISVWDTSTWQEVSLATYPTDDLNNRILIAFNSDLTRLYALSDFYTSANFVTWGFPEATQTEAEQALVQFFNLLAGGSYEQAAGLFSWDDMHSYPDYIKTQLPGFDLTDLPALFKELCSDPVFPCMPVKDVLYRSQLSEGYFRFVIDFSAPDGNLASWPACKNIPMTKSCDHRSGQFVFEVIQKEDGSFNIVNGLPPSIYLRLK